MSERRRRKSLSIFRPPMKALTPINDDDPPVLSPATLKKRRPASFFTPEPSSSPTSTHSNPSLERTSSKSSIDRFFSHKSRPHSLQKSGRPSSIFGSFRSLHSVNDDNDDLTRTSSTPTSVHSPSLGAVHPSSQMVLHHGDVQLQSNMFRRRNIYLVLTETHLVRFKNQAR